MATSHTSDHSIEKLTLDELHFRHNMTLVLLQSPIVKHPEDPRTEEEIHVELTEYAARIKARIDELKVAQPINNQD